MENGVSSGRNREILLELLEQRASDGNPNQNSVVPASADARNVSHPSSSEEDTTCLSADVSPSLFYTKQITWNNGTVLIVLQNENGPCPLIAIANVLLLRGRMKMHPNTTTVTTVRLLQFVAECVLDAEPIDHATQEYTDQYLRNVQYALESLESLSKGLNVNVKFSGPTDFEPTKELAIFDVLDIPLFHGWVVFNESKTLRAVGDLSYNDLTEKIIAGRQSKDMDAMESALMAEKFLTNSATQMTYEGLEQLLDTMRPRQLGVLFRNNHFSTIYKFVRIHNPDSACDRLAPCPSPGLFLLVTDQGFLNEPTIVWETLENIDGDGTFVDGSLKISPPKRTDGVYTSPSTDALTKQIDQDFLVALSLQNEHKSTASFIKDDKKLNPSNQGMQVLIPGAVSSSSSDDKDWKSNYQDMQVVSNVSSGTSLSSDDKNWKPIWRYKRKANVADKHVSKTTVPDKHVSKTTVLDKHTLKANVAEKRMLMTDSRADLEYARGVYRAGQRTQERFLPEEMANVRPSASVMQVYDSLEQELYPGESKEDLEAAAAEFFGHATQPHSAKKAALAAEEKNVSMKLGVRVAHMLDLSTGSALSHSPAGSIDPDDGEMYYQSEEGPDPKEDPKPPPGVLSALADCVIL